MVYIELSNGFKIQGKITLLLQALYNLRQSPLLWQRLLTEALTTLSLQSVPDKPYIIINNWLIVFFFVDDIIYIYRIIDEPRIDDFHTKLIQQFKIRDLNEATWFLSMKIIRNRLQRKL